MTSRRFAGYVALCLAQACLWESPLGTLPSIDAGVASPRADLERFAARLVGRYASPAGPRDLHIEQEFRADGTYTAECVPAPAGEMAKFCPFSGIAGDSRYLLTGIESTGAVNAVTQDTIYGIDVEGEFIAMQLSADGDTLTYVRVATLNSALVAILREVLGDAGVYDDAFRNAGVARNYIELKRVP
ncbi:MAG: hypothetical protein RL385_1630 [Pseudomonadota bacterium]|jgi:hypothetical protein